MLDLLILDILDQIIDLFDIKTVATISSLNKQFSNYLRESNDYWKRRYKINNSENRLFFVNILHMRKIIKDYNLSKIAPISKEPIKLCNFALLDDFIYNMKSSNANNIIYYLEKLQKDEILLRQFKGTDKELNDIRIFRITENNIIYSASYPSCREIVLFYLEEDKCFFVKRRKVDFIGGKFLQTNTMIIFIDKDGFVYKYDGHNEFFYQFNQTLTCDSVFPTKPNIFAYKLNNDLSINLDKNCNYNNLDINFKCEELYRTYGNTDIIGFNEKHILIRYNKFKNPQFCTLVDLEENRIVCIFKTENWWIYQFDKYSSLHIIDNILYLNGIGNVSGEDNCAPNDNQYYLIRVNIFNGSILYSINVVLSIYTKEFAFRTFCRMSHIFNDFIVVAENSWIMMKENYENILTLYIYSRISNYTIINFFHSDRLLQNICEKNFISVPLYLKDHYCEIYNGDVCYRYTNIP